MSGIQVCVDPVIQCAKEYGEAQNGHVPTPGATMDEIWLASYNVKTTSVVGRNNGGLAGRL